MQKQSYLKKKFLLNNHIPIPEFIEINNIDELNLENITIGGSATLGGSTITSWPTGGGSTQNLFDKVAVSGQTTISADNTADTLTFIAGTNVTITTDATTDSVTINSTASGGGGIANVVEDTTPQLGGNLDGGSYTIEAALFHPNTSDASATEFASIGGSTAFGVPFGELRSNWSSGTYVPLTWGPSGITVAGYLNASGDIQAVNFNSTSDESLKENVQTITNALDKVDSLRGVNFDWIDSGKAATGVIAQEIETILPEVVTEDEDGIKHVAYGNVVGVLIEAIKELKAEIEDLKK